MHIPISFSAAVLSLAACGGIAIVDGEPGGDGGGGSGGSMAMSSSSGMTVTSFDVVVERAFANANCEPPQADDPLGVTIDVLVTNTGASAGVADLGAATITGNPGAITFEVTPSTVGPLEPGQSQMLTIIKDMGSAQGSIDGCDLCQETNLQVEIAGASASVASISCVF